MPPQHITDHSSWSCRQRHAHLAPARCTLCYLTRAGDGAPQAASVTSYSPDTALSMVQAHDQLSGWRFVRARPDQYDQYYMAVQAPVMTCAVLPPYEHHGKAAEGMPEMKFTRRRGHAASAAARPLHVPAISDLDPAAATGARRQVDGGREVAVSRPVRRRQPA